jgi:hypothetical protein
MELEAKLRLPPAMDKQNDLKIWAGWPVDLERVVVIARHWIDARDAMRCHVGADKFDSNMFVSYVSDVDGSSYVSDVGGSYEEAIRAVRRWVQSNFHHYTIPAIPIVILLVKPDYTYEKVEMT